MTPPDGSDAVPPEPSVPPDGPPAVPTAVGRPEARRPQRAARGGAFRVGRILGVPVYITFSWVLLALVVTVGYGEYTGNRGGGATSYLFGGGLVVCLLASVLLHELGHALVARRFGVAVRGITLELLGGFTEMDREAPTPGSEAAIALAGPGVSLVLAGLGAAAYPFTPDGSLAADIVFQLAASNALVAAFNLLPGLPLDGGRALRAGLWRVTRNPSLADRAAGWVGRGIALATLAGGLLLYAHGQLLTFVGVAFTLIVAITLWNGASDAIRMVDVRLRLPMLQAGRLARPLHLVPSGTPLAEALRQRDERPDDPPVVGIADAGGRVVALLGVREVAAVPEGRRPWVAVDSVARTVLPAQRVPSDSTGAAVLKALDANPGRDLLVTVGEDVIGVLRLRDVIMLLEGSQPS